MESGLVGVAYFVMAGCVTICVGSGWFTWQTRRELVRLRGALRELRIQYEELSAWVIAQGLLPPVLVAERADRDG